MRLPWKARRDFEREMRDELQAHIDHRADDLVEAGLSRDEAMRQARIELGAVETYKEAARDERLFGRTRRVMEQTLRDLRYAARRLRHAPVYAGFSIVSIGIGAGVTTAMFAIMGATFWPVTGIDQPRRVAMVANMLQGAPAWERSMSMADFIEYRDRQQSFAALSAVSRVYQPFAIGTATELMQGEAVSGNYFTMLAVPAVMGRVLQPTDDRAGAPPVVVLSHMLWRLRFASDPRVIGQIVRIGGAPFEIVGVASRAYRGLSPQPARGANFWIAMQALSASGAYQSPLERPDDHSRLTLSVVGRLAPAVSVEQAHVEASGVGAVLDQTFVVMTTRPTANGIRQVPGARGWTVRSIHDINSVFAGVAPLALFSIFGLVLAVACTNLANLSLARGSGRHQELAVRLALGASRGRLVRELASESVLIGIVGFVLALAVSASIMALAATPAPLFNGISAPIDPHLTAPVLGVAAAAVALALLVCGVWPAVKLSRADVRGVIANGGSVGTSSSRATHGLIRAQMIVSVAFFCAAAVFISALSAQARHDPGIDLDHLTVARTAFRLQRWDQARSLRAIDALASVPASRYGFRAVAATSSVPFGSNLYVHAMVGTEDGPLSPRDQPLLLASTPGIFDALGIPLVSGRPFDGRDTLGALPVVVISESLSKRLFGTAASVGRELRMQGGINAIETKLIERRTVIGISRDTDVGSLMRGGGDGLAFVPVAQRYEPTSFVVARSTEDTDAGAGSLRALVSAADPDIAIDTAARGLVMLGGGWIAARIAAAVSLAIGVVTLILTLAGLSGVLAQVVLRRTREIGIRKALGADARAIMWLIVKDGAKPVLGGTLIGLGVGILGGFLVRAAIPVEATPVQPLAILIVAIAVVPSTLLACYIPARRAVRVEPNLTLKDS